MIDESNQHVPLWDGTDLSSLLRMRRVDGATWRTTCANLNSNNRVFGGQLLAQALMAASDGIDPARKATALQFMFLKGAESDRPIEFTLAHLQQGRNYSSRHVRGRQGGRIVCDAQVSFALAVRSPEHEWPSQAVQAPEDSMALQEVPPAWAQAISAKAGTRTYAKPAYEYRLPEPPHALLPQLPRPRLKVWIRLTRPLPDEPHMHAAALTFLSDHWLNYTVGVGHVPELQDGERLYEASLNQSVWFHRAARADDWLLFDMESPVAGNGRGLVIAQVRDRAGHLVATCTQQSLLVPHLS